MNRLFMALMAVMVSFLAPSNEVGFFGVAGETVEFELMEATIVEIQKAVAAGALTYERLTALYLQRIALYNGDTHAVLDVNPQAVADAIAMDAEFQESGSTRGPLHGIPVLLKDLIDQAGVPTTAGSVSMQQCIPPDDAEVTKALKEAGAIILGKVSLSEFAASFGRLGYSSLGGTVLNPYNFDRSASGSSSGTFSEVNVPCTPVCEHFLHLSTFLFVLVAFSGSGAAVAANFAVIALGSDTAGSIRGPSSSTSVVGIKPTKDLVSLDGVVPYSYFVDVVGPMARTVTDASIALTVMASSTGTDMDYASGLEVGALSGKRLARITGFSGGNSDVDALFDASVADMESLGATIVEVDLSSFLNDTEVLDGIVSGWSVLGRILDYECKDVDRYLESAGEGCPDDLTQIVDILDTYAETPFNAMNPPRLDGFKSCLASNSTAEDPEYIRITQTVVPAMEQALLDVMESMELDAFIYPSMLCPSRITWFVEDPTWVCETGDQWNVDYVANSIGWPDVSVPMGYVSAGNAPASVSFLGPKLSEKVLLGFAYGYEQKTMHRVPPPGFDALSGETITYSEDDGPQSGGKCWSISIGWLQSAVAIVAAVVASI